MRGRDTYQQHHSALVCWQCDSVIPRKIRKEFKKHATSHRQKPRWYIGWQNFCVLAGLLLLLLLFSPDRIHINNSTIQNLVQPGCPAEEKINICQVLKCIVIKQTRGWILPNVLWSLCHSQLFLPIRFSPVAVISCACSRLLSSHLDMKIAITELGATKKKLSFSMCPRSVWQHWIQLYKHSPWLRMLFAKSESKELKLPSKLCQSDLF